MTASVRIRCRCPGIRSRRWGRAHLAGARLLGLVPLLLLPLLPLLLAPQLAQLPLLAAQASLVLGLQGPDAHLQLLPLLLQLLVLLVQRVLGACHQTSAIRTYARNLQLFIFIFFNNQGHLKQSDRYEEIHVKEQT